VLFVVIHSVNYERLMANAHRRQMSHGSIKYQLDNPDRQDPQDCHQNNPAVITN
jgi:hypothetical protein